MNPELWRCQQTPKAFLLLFSEFEEVVKPKGMDSKGDEAPGPTWGAQTGLAWKGSFIANLSQNQAGIGFICPQSWLKLVKIGF